MHGCTDEEASPRAFPACSAFSGCAVRPAKRFNVTPGHNSCWATTGVIYDCGVTSGPSIVGSTTQNDFTAFNGSGSLIDSGISAVNTNSMTALWNFNGGLTGAVNGVNVTGTPSAGNVPVATSSSAASWGTVAASSFATQAANSVLAGPSSGSAAIPTFRTLGISDLPITGTPSAGFVPVASSSTAATWRQANFINPLDYGAANNGTTDDTTALTNAIAAAAASGQTLYLAGSYGVTELNLHGTAANPISVTGRATLVGLAATATPALLDVSGYVDINGALAVTAAFNANYTSCIWYHGNGAGGANGQYTNFYSTTTAGCLIGWRIGDVAYPSAANSEVSVFGGNTYGTPTAVQVEGTNTVVTFSGPSVLDSSLAVVNTPGNGWFQGTSTTSVAIPTVPVSTPVSKTFTTQTGLAITAGMPIEARHSTALGSATNIINNYMVGTVTSYNSGTGSLVMSVTGAAGSGTFTAWNIEPRMAAIRSIGGYAKVIGGEVQQAEQQAALVELQALEPVLADNAAQYGSVLLIGTSSEIVGMALTTINIGALTINTGLNATFALVGETGYNSHDTGPFINTTADFYGNIILTDNFGLSATVTRTNYNVVAGSTNTNVYPDLTGLGVGFQNYLSGISGGTVVTWATSGANSNITSLTGLTTPLSGAQGGTGLGVAAVGDILYASAVTPTWSRLGDVAVGNVLVSGGVSTAPAWSATPTLTSVAVGTGTCTGSPAPSSIVGNSGTGFCSVSTTGLGLLVNDALIGDYGITNPSDWTLAGNLILGGQILALGDGVTTLSRNGSTGTLTVNSNAANIILAPASTTALTLSSTTATWASATYANCTSLTTSSGAMGCTASDARLKSPEGDLDPDEALAFAENVPARFFTFKNPGNPFSDDRRHIGYFAQEVNRYAPHIAAAMVRTMAPTDLTPNGTLALDYDQPGVIALSAVKALAGQFDEYRRTHP